MHTCKGLALHIYAYDVETYVRVLVVHVCYADCQKQSKVNTLRVVLFAVNNFSDFRMDGIYLRIITRKKEVQEEPVYTDSNHRLFA